MARKRTRRDTSVGDFMRELIVVGSILYTRAGLYSKLMREGEYPDMPGDEWRRLRVLADTAAFRPAAITLEQAYELYRNGTIINITPDVDDIVIKQERGA